MFYNFFHDNFRMKIFNTEEKKIECIGIQFIRIKFTKDICKNLVKNLYVLRRYLIRCSYFTDNT